ncbi:holin [Streptomyces roseicoloratus]|uniref:holin n=1 Tax=Streptomyces roseicoloratus TaxID=2508722 RepID=UPI001009A383|nr:holin [Streptomyces roseicoloratus]
MSRLILDTVERTIGTYAVTFLGLVLADGFDLTSVSALKAAAIAAIPAALSVVKAAVGSLVGDQSTVGWVPRQRS